MPIFWVLIAFPILLFLQRWIHTHLHGLSLLLTGKPERAVVVYALVLLPGVLLHELSHWLTANLLGVRTGSFSIFPRRRPDGTVQLGYVEYYRGKTLDPLRETLIGGAPLIVGTAVILLIAFYIFDLPTLVLAIETGDIDVLSLALGDLFRTDFILLWIYLIFAISNAMLPSASDRRAWPAFLLAMGALALILYLLGLQDYLVNGLVGPGAAVFSYLGTALSIAITVDLLFMLGLNITESLVSRIKGVSIVYGASSSETTS